MRETRHASVSPAGRASVSCRRRARGPACLACRGRRVNHRVCRSTPRQPRIGASAPKRPPDTSAGGCFAFGRCGWRRRLQCSESGSTEVKIARQIAVIYIGSQPSTVYRDLSQWSKKRECLSLGGRVKADCRSCDLAAANLTWAPAFRPAASRQRNANPRPPIRSVHGRERQAGERQD